MCSIVDAALQEDASTQNDAPTEDQSLATTGESGAPAVVDSVTNSGPAAASAYATELKQPGCSTTFMLNVIWQEEFCAVAVDQIVFMVTPYLAGLCLLLCSVLLPCISDGTDSSLCYAVFRNARKWSRHTELQ